MKSLSLSSQSIFFTEIQELTNNKKQLGTSLIKQLGLIFDSNKVVRCRTRLNRGEYSYDFKHPILIPYQSHLAKLIIWKCHVELKHAGVQQTLATIREKFWIPKGRKLVNNMLHKCIICTKFKGKFLTRLPPADLPEFRIEKMPVFYNCGIDFAGPFLVKLPYQNKRGPLKTVKVYILLFVCAVTRGVQLEMTYNMTAEAVVNAFRRFTSDFGLPGVIYSDNFKSFPKVYKDIVSLLESSKVSDYLKCKNIEWKYSLPRAPWFNGFTERLVGLTKSVLKRTLQRSLVTPEEFYTVLKEISCIVNHRPISYNYYDLDSEKSVSPADLMYTRSNRFFPQTDKKVYVDEPDNTFVQTRLSYLEQLVNQFWRKFHSEYLNELKERHARLKISNVLQEEVEKGKVYLLKGEKSPATNGV